MYFFVLFDGRTMAMGEDNSGGLGFGELVNKLDKPTEIIELQSVRPKKMTAGAWFTLALDYDKGEVWVWGENLLGTLGLGTDEERVHRPAKIEFPEPVKIIDIAAGGKYTLALDQKGRVFSWGSNNWGQLGLNGGGHRNRPTRIEVLVEIKHIDCGEGTSYALDRAGQVFVWGRNLNGLPRPLETSGIIRSVTAGDECALLVDHDGRLSCYVVDNENYKLESSNSKFVSIVGNMSNDFYSALDEEGKVSILCPKGQLNDLPDVIRPPTTSVSISDTFLQIPTDFQFQTDFYSCLFLPRLPFMITFET